jgi:hypothetical protein
MQRSSQEILKKELHPHANQVAKEYVDKFEASLVGQSRLLAFHEDADLVLSNHVNEAFRIVRSDRKKRRAHELMIILGSVFLGAFLQGFFTELMAGRQFPIAVYTSMGFVGMILVFAGVRR